MKSDKRLERAKDGNRSQHVTERLKGKMGRARDGGSHAFLSGALKNFTVVKDQWGVVLLVYS